MKIVINRCFGGFSLSEKACKMLAEIKTGKGEQVEDCGPYMDVERTDPDLVHIVEEIGNAASGAFAQLAVIDIPDGICYEIDDYDGIETVREQHRTWT